MAAPASAGRRRRLGSFPARPSAIDRLVGASKTQNIANPQGSGLCRADKRIGELRECRPTLRQVIKFYGQSELLCHAQSERRGAMAVPSFWAELANTPGDEIEIYSVSAMTRLCRFSLQFPRCWTHAVGQRRFRGR